MPNKKQKVGDKKKVLYISAGILSLFLLTGIILVVTGVFSIDRSGSEELVQVQELKPFEIEEEEEEVFVEIDDEIFFEKNTVMGLNDSLERTDVINEDFPSEIPLSGGKVITSSDSGLDISVEIEVNTTGQEALDWYVNKLNEEGWTVTNQSIESATETWFSGSFEYSSLETDEGTIIRGTIHVAKTNQQQSPVITIRSFLN